MITKVITAHVPVALAAQVDKLANNLERSRGWVVKEALSMWVAQEDERRQWTLDALADVDAGRTIDHQDVTAWANSLGTAAPLPLPTPPAKRAKARKKATAQQRPR